MKNGIFWKDAQEWGTTRTTSTKSNTNLNPIRRRGQEQVTPCSIRLGCPTPQTKSASWSIVPMKHVSTGLTSSWIKQMILTDSWRRISSLLETLAQFQQAKLTRRSKRPSCRSNWTKRITLTIWSLMTLCSCWRHTKSLSLSWLLWQRGWHNSSWSRKAWILRRTIWSCCLHRFLSSSTRRVRIVLQEAWMSKINSSSFLKRRSCSSASIIVSWTTTWWSACNL